MDMIIESPSGRRILNGPEKVAALLLAVDRPLAEQLLRRFEPEEIRDVARSAAELGRLPIQALEDIVTEFSSHFSTGADIMGTASEAARLISNVLPPEDAAEIVSDLLGSSNESVWQRLEVVPDSELATYLLNEHPQSSAAVLHRLPPGLAGRVMSHMSGALRKDIVHRMLTIKAIPSPCIRILEGGIQEDLLTRRTARPKDPSIRFADMLNRMERAEMEDVLGAIAEMRPDLAEAVRERLFSFEDIVKLSPMARALLFDRVPTEKLVQALMGVDEDFRESVLASLTVRARRIVEGELQSGGNVNPRDTAAARRIIADIVLEMAEAGQIDIRAPKSSMAA